MGEKARARHGREGLLLAAFLVLVAIGVATVVLPELSDTPDSDARESPAAGDADTRP